MQRAWRQLPGYLQLFAFVACLGLEGSLRRCHLAGFEIPALNTNSQGAYVEARGS